MNARQPECATLPAWLDTLPVEPDPAPPARTESFFDHILPTILRRVVGGMTLTDALAADVRDIPYAVFRQWLHANPDRERRYHEAQTASVDSRVATVQKRIDDIDDLDTPEQINRLTLQFNFLKWQASIYDRKRYGDVKQVQIDQTISVRSALEKARERVIQGTVVATITQDQPADEG